MVELNVCNIMPGKYMIDESGNIFSMYKNKILNVHPDKDGYLRIMLKTTDGTQKRFYIHRLVAFTFLGNPPETLKDPEVDHINEPRTNNNISNLRWLNNDENVRRRFHPPIGENNGRSKLKEKDVKQIIKLLSTKDDKELAGLYNVTSDIIRSIRNNVTWKHLER